MASIGEFFTNITGTTAFLWYMQHTYCFIPMWALLLDALIGDPNSKYHPVVGIGKVISFYENLLYMRSDTPKKKVMYGGIAVCMTLLTVVIIASILIYIASLIATWAAYIIQVLLVYVSISPRSLAEAGYRIATLLKNNDIEQARVRVGWIVGRRTDELDESEITRATIETIAENTVDGIVSPLLFFAVFGPVGAIFYRAANTLDSMMGYKNDRYIFFGRIAAKFDDFTNYIPARISFILLVIAAYICGFDYKQAWKLGLRDAHKHPSPNGGYAEAPVAGALHIRLGGYNQYFDTVTFREYMGEAQETMRGIHIYRTIRLMYTASILAGILSIIIACGVVSL